MSPTPHILLGGPLDGKPVEVPFEPQVGMSMLYAAVDPAQPPAVYRWSEGYGQFVFDEPLSLRLHAAVQPPAAPRDGLRRWSRAIALAVAVLALFGLHSLLRIVLP